MKTPTSAVLVVRRMPVFFAYLHVSGAIKYRAATLPSARKARSHLPFQGRYIRPAEGLLDEMTGEEKEKLYQNDPTAIDRGLKKAMEVLK